MFLGYTVFMPQAAADARLRNLSLWLPGWDELLPITDRITEVRAELKGLQTQAAEIRARLISTCPLELDELEIRFWTKVQIVDDEDSCWEWKRARRAHAKRSGIDEYGSFRWTNPQTGVSEVAAASRVSLFLTTGEMPDHGCHTCDNPPCVRPKHLYSGTHAENMQDRKARGRYVLAPRLLDQNGARNHTAKLTDDLVIKARQLAGQGLMTWEIHQAIGEVVSETVLRWAITGRTWKHLDSIEPPVVKPRNGSAIRGKRVPRRAKR